MPWLWENAGGAPASFVLVLRVVALAGSGDSRPRVALISREGV